MIIKKYDSREEWMADRARKITGSTAGDVISKGGPTKDAIAKVLTDFGIEFKSAAKKEVLETLLPEGELKKLRMSMEKKKAAWKLVADCLTLPEDPENHETPMDRGNRLEPVAMERFIKETGKEVDASLIIWMRDDNESIAISPDGDIQSEKAAVEVKCLASATHLEAHETSKIPDDLIEQRNQYFAVNDELKKLYFAFYDDRFLNPDLQFFIIEVSREEVQKEIDEQLTAEREIMEWRDEIVLKYSNY